ncbi:MAG: M15 family metallopeptidase [Pseudomonadota bacterium]
MPLTFEQLSGQTDSHLTELPGERHQLQAEAADAYLRMQRDAASEGINVAIASGFRSLARQLGIWNRKWQGQLTLRNHAGVPLDTASLPAEDKLWAILHWSALPGSSRHHWGTDFDVYDPAPFAAADQQLQLLPSEYTQTDGPCYDLWCWLKRRAHEYGFFFPYARYQHGVAAEPWHLSYQPLAAPLLAQLTVGKLSALLMQLDIQGQQTVLRHIDKIHRQYILNICQEQS